MWYDLLCNITISIVIVVILHYLYNYLKATYTTKKHRDVGRFHNDKYQAILQELKQREMNPQSTNTTMNASFLPNQDAEEMQNSLMEFVQNII